MATSEILSVVTIGIGIVVAIVGFLIRLNVTQSNHAMRISNLEADQRAAEQDIRDVKALITNTRETMIREFGELKSLVMGRRGTERAVADVEERDR